MNEPTTAIDTDLGDDFRAYSTPDPEPDSSYLRQEGWGDALLAFEAGDFSFVGVVLEQRCATCGEWRTVGSLWGIEHDGTMSSEDYLSDTARELLQEVA